MSWLDPSKNYYFGNKTNYFNSYSNTIIQNTIQLVQRCHIYKNGIEQS